jgi:hypothetical protein
MKKILGIALGAAVIALAGCGSSDSGPAPVTPTAPTTSNGDVPASATGSSAGLTEYANAQITATSNSSEPVVIGDSTTLPVDNTTETSL